MDQEVLELLQLPRVRLAQAAALCGVSLRQVKRWVKAGKVRSLKVGKCRQVVLEDLPVRQDGPGRKQPARECPEKARRQWNEEALADL
jgi:hypothetical protein